MGKKGHAALGERPGEHFQNFSLCMTSWVVKLKGQIMYFERVLNEGTYALTYFK